MTNLFLNPNAFDFGAIFGNIVKDWYKYLILIEVIALCVIAVLALKKYQKRNTLNKTQSIVYISILTALCVVANVFTINLGEWFQVSLTITVTFIAGYMLGGIGGFVVGFVGDLIGCIIMPFGAYNPIISVSMGLFGFVPGIAFTFFKGNEYVKTAICAVITLVVCTMFVNTFGLYLVYGLGKKTFWAYLVVRLPVQAINAVINCALCMGVTAVLKKILPKSKFTFVEDKSDIECSPNEDMFDEQP